jgi:hypothetical protein
VRTWRLLGAALAMPVMLGGLLLVTAEPAAACTCLPMTEAQHAGSANAVFVGALVDSRVDPSVLTRKYRQARLKEVGLPRFDGQGWWLGQATCLRTSSWVVISNSSGVR